MFRSAGLRFIAVGFLALLMFIPLNLVSGVINDRSSYSRQTITEISREWGGHQRLSGPLMVIPVTEEVTYDRRREAVDAITGLSLRDDKGNVIYEHFQETLTERRAPVFIYPDTLDISLSTETQTRHRGIFEVPVYTADAEITFDFDVEKAEDVLTGEEVAHWGDARLDVFLSSNRALRGEARLTESDRELALEPIAASNDQQSGITTALGDPREAGTYLLKLTMNGAQHLAAAATGRTTRLRITSDWPDPSFFGDFLPDASEI
ncbi:MAG: inner membrane CreD family protein, partial [Boseongicola sp.]